MPVWLIFALWGSATVFVAWLALASRFRRWWARRQESEVSTVDRMLAEAYPEIPPGL